MCIRDRQNTLSLLEKKHISKSNIEQFSKNAEKYILQWFDESDLCAFLREEYDTGTLPVSYTHLDVYKRQVLF